jgi:8-oxo-dGTP pyrophosphatase MutT (NUDIX family)
MAIHTSAFRLAFLSMAVAAFANAAAAPAGIAAFACVKGSAVYLLAFDPAPGRRAWGHLGGQAESGETGVQTALREFREESNCAFELPAAVSTQLKGPSIFPGSGFQTFVLEVPFVDATTVAQARECSHVERTQWVWVGHEALQAALDLSTDELEVRDGTPPKVHLWRPSRNALQKARQDGVLPTKDPCRVEPANRSESVHSR